MGAKVLAVVVALLATLVPGAPASASPDWLDHGTSASFDQGGRRTLVRDVRFAVHDGFDRVVIDLTGPIPDYNTRYSRTFRYEGSGEPIPIRGRSGMWINLFAAGHRDDGGEVYEGPRLARPGFPCVKALAVGGDSEGVFSLVVALRRRADHRVIRLESPRRLVIDFRHP
ncbi:hypothetical protein L2K70_14310 [Nocardioides KLBMP 9356]|uniref:AMIN-like domain-containing protein n=1 Tax=Nocardioides potassii TaxID=2911371 RepID=A0ABS9HEY4_9ACTN|nr:hypothetical protein [Nocardioides potassii]MCF6378784.1 hypothetical protein [Nocardioides potassii]